MTQPKDENAPYTTRPTTQVDLEERASRDFLPVKPEVDPNAVNNPYAVEGNDTSAYIGVDPDKMNYANDTEAPLKGDGAEDEQAAALLSGYAYGEDPKKSGEQTVGSGSSVPVVGVTTSGENVNHKLVDREGLQSKIAENDAAVAKGESPEPIRSTESFVSEGSASAPTTEEAPAPAPKKAAAPKPADQ